MIRPCQGLPLDSSSKSGASALVVVPAFDEAVNVVNLIDALLALPVAVDVLIVDDNSPDGTGALVRGHAQFERRVFLLQRLDRRGFASACQEGFRWGVERGYAICLEMDADFSHDPADVPRLLKEIEQGADIALGSRYVGGVRVINWPVRRLLLSLFAGYYTRLLSGIPMRDPTSGFKAIRSRVLRATDWSQFTADGYGFIVEFHFHAFRNGFRIVEVPIVFTERRRGDSKMSFRIMVESAQRIFRLACFRMFHPMRRADARAVESLEYA